MFCDILDKKQSFTDYKKLISFLDSHQTGFFLRG